MRNPHPPILALKLFRWYCRPDRLEELEGDLEELFYQRIEKGDSISKTRMYFWWNVFRCYRSYAKSKTQINILMLSLFKSYFKLALRNSWKNKWSVSVNVIGLGMALSLCVFFYMITAYNLEFDSFYQDTDDIYRVHHIRTEEGYEERFELSPVAMFPMVKEEMSGVSSQASYFAHTYSTKHKNSFHEEFIGFFSARFLDMFELPLKQGSWSGNAERPLVYLSEETAIKYFGNQLAVGNEITIYMADGKKFIVEVGGVLQKIPLNSSFDFNMIMSQAHYFSQNEMTESDWKNLKYATMFLEVPSGNTSGITESLQKYIPLQNKHHETWKHARIELIPFRSSIISDDQINSSYSNRRLRPQVYIIFSVLIGLVFLTACFNVANTSIALIAKRLKEIGVRKTLGAGNRQILFQFVMEMAIICALAFIIAVASANFTTRSILGLFAVTFQIQDISLTRVIAFIVLFLAFTSFIAGILPGLYAWKFQPVQIIRKTTQLKGINWLNKTLVVAQFSFSIAVLVAGVSFSRNIAYLDELYLGYDDDHLIHVPISEGDYEVISNELAQLPGTSISGSKHHVGQGGRYSISTSIKLDGTEETVQYYGVSTNYTSLMNFTLVSGRPFIDNSDADKSSILVSQAFEKKFFPASGAINQSVKIKDDNYAIVGVFQDIVDNVYEDYSPEPSVVGLAKEEEFTHLIVKSETGNLEDLNDQISEVWSGLKDDPYEGKLQKDFALGHAGRDTENLQKIFLGVAVLSVLLSLIGIFSLSKMNVAKRTKEITIRKVLGASLRDIMMAVNKSFTYILLIALLLGCALGYLISDSVLKMIYLFYVDISVVTSLLSGALIILISIFVLSGTTAEAASKNPSGGLRED